MVVEAGLGAGDVVALPRLHNPRAAAPEHLQEVLQRVAPVVESRVFEKIVDAVRWLDDLRPRGSLVVTGSFYHLSRARRALLNLGRG